ncbi:hypothetical protein MTO96_017549 [Rhipicephalus appendiculatus]
MLIKVKTLTGKEIEIDIEPTDRVERIKERVEEKEGIPPAQQRLIFSGKQMNDDKTAADYKVTWRLGSYTWCWHCEAAVSREDGVNSRARHSTSIHLASERLQRYPTAPLHTQSRTTTSYRFMVIQGKPVNS